MYSPGLSLGGGLTLTTTRSSKGTPNANPVMKDAVKDYPGEYSLVIFSSAQAKAPDSVTDAVSGHSWLAAIDTNTKTVTALGLYAKEDVSRNHPDSPGEILDDSETKFTVAHG